MRILALDASLACCSAALLAGDRVLAERSSATERGHAALLPAMAEAVLAEAGIAATSLDAVAAVIGPGGFTGLRAALALAAGLALGSGRPGIGVTTGEALVAGLAPPRRLGRPVWSLVDTRRGRVILERFAPGAASPEAPAAAFAPESLPPPPAGLLLVGDAAGLAARHLAAAELVEEARLPQAAAAARVAALRLAGGIPPLPLRPLYVEAPAVRMPG